MHTIKYAGNVIFGGIASILDSLIRRVFQTVLKSMSHRIFISTMYFSH